MKRQFDGFQLPQQRLAEDPSREYTDPKVVQTREAPAFDDYDAITVS
jgi:hypothetical protein